MEYLSEQNRKSVDSGIVKQTEQKSVNSGIVNRKRVNSGMVK